MTVEEVRQRVEEVAAISVDPHRPAAGPGAHAAEDDRFRDVLQAIADGGPDAAALAAEVLKTSALEFDRWYE